jgi:hypothetical protein
MRSTPFVLLPLLLAACAATPGGGNPSVARALAAGGTCPAPDPVRDGPLVDAIRLDDATTVEAILARDPGDARARAALALISGQGRPDPDEAACFAPYLA